MDEIDLTKIKYYPDRFYICLDGFDTDNLTTFITDLNIEQQQAVFIHEYYHYLTNITTFSGIRQFHLNFCDRFRVICRLTYQERINAYPINTNTFTNCEEDVNYWNSVSDIINGDDIDYNLVKETEQSQNKKFEIVSIEKEIKPMFTTIEGVKINGGRHFIKIAIDGLVNINSFYLTYGLIDEFLSSSIDEFLFEHDLSQIDYRTLSQRPFYPYHFFNSLLSYYGINRCSAFEKILISYFSLNSDNPSVDLIELLEKLKQEDHYERFHNDPENYLLENYKKTEKYSTVINKTIDFANELFDQGRIHIAQAIMYFQDKFYIAQKLKEQDLFYFIRPFFVTQLDTEVGKQKFLLSLSRIINVFSPPVILKDKSFKYVDKLTSFGESTMLILATYEIFESLKTNQIAKRPDYLKEKYTFPDNDPNCDVFETFKGPPITSVFQLALNELSIYGVYLEELCKRNYKSTDS